MTFLINVTLAACLSDVIELTFCFLFKVESYIHQSNMTSKFIISYLIPLYIHDIDDFFNYFNAVVKNRRFVINKDVMALKKKEFITNITIMRNGILYEKYQQYSNGNKYGDFYRYDCNGNVILHYDNTHKKGYVYSYCEERDHDGKPLIKAKISHVKTIKQGKGYSYYKDGSIESECYMANDKLDGPFYIYNKDGCQSHSALFDAGRNISIKRYTHTCWLSDREYMYEKMSMVSGEVSCYMKQLFSKDGVMLSEEQFINECSDEVLTKDHMKHGSHKEWYSNGQIKLETSYNAGILHGSYKEWDKEGNLIEDAEAIDGNVISYNVGCLFD
jgi:antitoxin component YwqK of YwqJK toxin-antitoxin module